MRASSQSPYRQRPTATGPAAGEPSLARDAAVVTVIAVAIGSIAWWTDAIEVVATRVMGFPKLP